MPVTDEQASWFSDAFERIVKNVSEVIVGKESVLRLVLAALFSDGHVLLEDVAGTGKTSLARALSGSIDGTSNRIRFTPDLAVSDVIGTSAFNSKESKLEFYPGPIFASIVLVDEVDNSTPKTVGALLDAMEERAVSYDGLSHAVGRPFMVIATQNPAGQLTGQLTAAQLDHFMIRTSLGYPDSESTIDLLMEAATAREALAIVSPTTIVTMQELTGEVFAAREVMGYVNEIALATRTDPSLRLGVSTRAVLALGRISKAWAMSKGRTFVLPEDVRNLAPVVFGHRVLLSAEAVASRLSAEEVLARVIGDVQMPTPFPSSTPPPPPPHLVDQEGAAEALKLGGSFAASDGETVVVRIKSPRVSKVPKRGPKALTSVIVELNGESQIIPVPAILGRAPNLEESGLPASLSARLVILTGVAKNVSRNHVRFDVEGGTVVATDLHSRNGTRVTPPGGDTATLRPGEPTPILDGSTVEFGGDFWLTVRSGE